MSIENNPCMLYKEGELHEEARNKVGQNAFETVRKIVANNDRENAQALLNAVENEYMEYMYSEVPEAKKKNGQWNKAKFMYRDGEGKLVKGGLPIAYRTAKSVCLNGKDAGVDMSTVTGKSAIEKATKRKEGLTVQQSLDAARRAIAHANRQALREAMTQEEWAVLFAKHITPWSKL